MYYKILNSFSKDYIIKKEKSFFSKKNEVYNIKKLGSWCSFVFDEISENNKYKKKKLISAVARSIDGKKVLKLQFKKHPRKRNSLLEEAKIIKFLNEASCMSAPKLIDFGYIALKDIEPEIEHKFSDKLNNSDMLEYLVVEYLPFNQNTRIADVVLSMLEQKALGIYHADIKPSNIRFNGNDGIAILIDYDQAQKLSNDVIKYNANSFMEWCDINEKKKFDNKFSSWTRHFKNFNKKRHLDTMFRNGAFNLSLTSLYKKQVTTNTKNGVYHTINSKTIYADGIRNLDDRTKILDNLKFISGEKVLDVGCNAGLLCHYLSKRGCVTTGYEMDRSIINSAKIISNILGIKANFETVDLDKINKIENFDTICLFSVIHHTSNMRENGIKISKSCKRILIECRLGEHGKKPEINKYGKVYWKKSSSWDYNNEEELKKGLENLFPGFNVKKLVGYVDRSRMILEMCKNL